MNRRILIQVTTPGVIIGLILFGACFASAWYIDRLQKDMAKILSRNVKSLQVALELEKFVRQLRFHSLLNLADPKPARQKAINADHDHFEEALRSVKESAHTPDEKTLADDIEKGYRQYLLELEAMRREVSPKDAGTDFARRADQHPINKVVVMEPLESPRWWRWWRAGSRSWCTDLVDGLAFLTLPGASALGIRDQGLEIRDQELRISELIPNP